MNYYIADTHFGHRNVIKFDSRPFGSMDEMEKIIISNWNNVVNDEDVVYVLGDFSWYKEEKTLEILDMLNGKKVLIMGNHDRISLDVAKKFSSRVTYLEINDGENRVVMSHYPMPFWNGQFRNTVHLYGHVHNSYQQEYCEKVKAEIRYVQNIPMRTYNVGCMMPYMEYRPKTLKEILDYHNERKMEVEECRW